VLFFLELLLFALEIFPDGPLEHIVPAFFDKQWIIDFHLFLLLGLLIFGVLGRFFFG
jgi:hypothetical protein